MKKYYPKTVKVPTCFPILISAVSPAFLSALDNSKSDYDVTIFSEISLRWESSISLRFSSLDILGSERVLVITLETAA
jgi:hypothetical protein